ncbi:MAG TPA: hypothetical protein VHJ77_17845 [Vicinamibacterales bacterium]|nr:hypothetical protein [Vicinamibacterales bacterium]
MVLSSWFQVRRRVWTVLGFVIAGAAVAAAWQAPQQPRHVERVEVSRLIVDARVVDDAGAPVRDLGVDDFKIKIDGRPARIESVRWVGEGGTRTAAPDRSAALPDAGTEPTGRLIVFLFRRT